MTQSTVWALPFPSQELEGGPVVHHQYGDLTMTLEGPADEDTTAGALTLRFSGVVGYRFLAFDQCREVHLDAYDKLIDVAAFDWDITSARRLRIFLDEVGCYDIACETVEIPPA